MKEGGKEGREEEGREEEGRMEEGREGGRTAFLLKAEEGNLARFIQSLDKSTVGVCVCGRACVCVCAGELTT